MVQKAKNFMKQNSIVLKQKTADFFYRPGFQWRRAFLFVFLSSFLASGILLANNLEISNVSLSAQNATANTVKAQFDISWENSWRNNTNYDAAWVFVKYSTDSGSTWHHATLKTAGTNPSGFSGGSGTSMTVLVPSDKKGAFIYRAANGYGNITNTAAQLVWDYNADGLSDSTSVEIQVFGIEMVYVPAGSFSAGDGNNDSATPPAGFFNASSGTYESLSVSSEGSLTLGGSSSGYLMARSGAGTADDFNSGSTQSLPAEFPKGYAAFFLMKYEITEGQYVDFLNTLTDTEKSHRDITSSRGKNSDSTVTRNTISWPGSGDASTSAPQRACSYLLWTDLAAYADWAALRPMSELEYEKAARGTVTPKALEYAWGNTRITAAADISGTEDGTETITTENANANYGGATLSGGDGGTGPLRVGIFASSGKMRWQSGASYYGVMELSGNLWEQAASVGSSAGRAFTGSHGDGTLCSASGYEGNATNTDWPGIDGDTSRGVTGDDGGGIRGGCWNDSAAYQRVSDRYHANRSCMSGGDCNDFTGSGQGTCEGNAGCSWGSCSNCTDWTASGQSTCESNSGCAWTPDGGHNCTDYNANQSACETTSGCTWNTNTCSCSSYNGDPTNCNATSGCVYESASCSGFSYNYMCTPTGCTWNDCGSQSTLSGCNATTGCSWGGSSCSNFNGNQASCQAQDQCSWDSTACSAWNSTDQSTCESGHSGCTWDSQDCQTWNGGACNDFNGCSGHSGCTFRSNNCSDYYGNQSTCQSNCGCTWCASLSDQTSCEAATCTWNYSDCSAFNGDEGTCTGAAGCSWSDPNCTGQYNTSCTGASNDANTCVGTHSDGNCDGTYYPGTCSGTTYPGTCSGSYGCSGDNCSGDYYTGNCNGTCDNSNCSGTYYAYTCEGSYNCSCSGTYGTYCDSSGYGGRCVRTAS